MTNNSNDDYQNWLNRSEYPFEHRYIKLDAGNMHYIDEGNGDVILFVHGTPTWSFLYRKFIKSLSSSFRCIAIDHIGFGLSEKPERLNGSPQDHAQNLVEFIKNLDLQNITLVVHDFGGPIGLAAAIENPERVNKIIMFNTWLWETASNNEARRVDRIINSLPGRFLYLNLNFSPKFLLKKGIVNKKNLPNAIHQHYIKPFPTKSSRKSLLNLAKALVGSSEWYQKQWEKLNMLLDKKWLIIWGLEDEFITKDFLEKWKQRLPDPTVFELNSGHFVQEERSYESIQAIIEFMKR